MKTDFGDLGHLQYYNVPRTRTRTRFCVTAKKEKEKDKEMKQTKDSKKKKWKLLQDLSQNLSVFADTDFGLDFSQLHSPQVSEAADVILKQLEKLKAEEQEEKAKLQAEQMAAMSDDDSSSSSSESSQSSDSECGAVIDMNCLRSQPTQQYDDSQSAAAQVAAVLAASLQSLPTTNATEERASEDIVSLQLHKHEKEAKCRPTTSSCSSKRVEVCMGNKCKKLGSVMLMEEFTRQMGEEGVVVGCKCMGKCKSAPNVRVMNTAGVEGATDVLCVRTANNNPLCVGVGLGDVTAIVASLLGDAHDFNLAAV